MRIDRDLTPPPKIDECLRNLDRFGYRTGFVAGCAYGWVRCAGLLAAREQEVEAQVQILWYLQELRRLQGHGAAVDIDFLELVRDSWEAAKRRLVDRHMPIELDRGILDNVDRMRRKYYVDTL